MGTLHTVNKSPFRHQTLTACLAIAQPGDSVLLIEDGVYAAQANTPAASQLQQARNAGIAVYVLKEDIEQRALTTHSLIDIPQVDYTGFVELSTRHLRIQSWYE